MQSGTSDLVKKLNNPPANIISLPLENDTEAGAGSEQAFRYTPKFQPVIPFSMNRDWLLITWDGGPTVEVVKQKQGWTISTLVNHFGSFAGSEMAEVSYTLLDPRLVHAWENGFSIKLETESGYDWKSAQWIVPLDVGVSQRVKLGKRPINLGADVQYHAVGGSNDARWGVRFTISLNFKE